jgi:hypothetical protein
MQVPDVHVPFVQDGEQAPQLGAVDMQQVRLFGSR